MNSGGHFSNGTTFDQPPGPQPAAGDEAGSSNGLASGLGISSAEFEIFEWFPALQSCQIYFLNHAQHDYGVQAVSTLINIRLPFQWLQNPLRNYPGTSQNAPEPVTTFPPSRTGAGQANASPQSPTAWISLIPYIRRLVITGFDKEAVLHAFFGDDWRKGVGPLQECERRNYMFAAKSGGWLKVKEQYDMNSEETVPFIQAPQDVAGPELDNADKLWSQWLAVEDWMLGPRAPEAGYYERNDQVPRQSDPSSSS